MLFSVWVSAKIAIAAMTMLTTMPRPFSLKPLRRDFVGAATFRVFIRAVKHIQCPATDSQVADTVH